MSTSDFDEAACRAQCGICSGNGDIGGNLPCARKRAHDDAELRTRKERREHILDAMVRDAESAGLYDL